MVRSEKYKVIICGGREFADYPLLCLWADHLLRLRRDIEIVSGKEPGGADMLGERYAAEKGFPVAPFPADWTRHGLAAGPIRNEEMARYANACIAFWDGMSPGTRSMIKFAKRYKLNLKIVRYK